MVVSLYNDGKSQPEICEALGMTKNQVKKRLEDAREHGEITNRGMAESTKKMHGERIGQYHKLRRGRLALNMFSD